MIVAVDGPVAAGKGMLGRRLAEHYHFAYLDTGSLYRAVGGKVLKQGLDPHDAAVSTHAAQELTEEDRNTPDLRAEKTGEAASVVAAIPGVRQALLEFQRHFAHHPPAGKDGAVLDGRDIGTVVCVDADVKVFVTASAEVRAHRRWLEIKEKGGTVTEAQVLEDLKKRDARDQSRSSAPLKPAEDAIVIDTSVLDRHQSFDAVVAVIEEKRRQQ